MLKLIKNEIDMHCKMTISFLLREGEENGESKENIVDQFSNVYMETKRELLMYNIKPKDALVWFNFRRFMDTHKKEYFSRKETLDRFKIYKKNRIAIKFWSMKEKGSAVYGETKFSDLSPEEFKAIYLPYVWDKSIKPDVKVDVEMSENDEIPTNFDWKDHNGVTSVSNQGSCGDCWAESVVANIEGAWAKKTGDLLKFSVQEVVDCDVVDMACNGGLPQQAYKEIIRIGGLELEEKYPYEGRLKTCRWDVKQKAAYINGSVLLPQDEEKMKIWLFKNNAISVGINANPLQFYRHGIFHPWKMFCSPNMLNHAVLITGFGVEEKTGKQFWIIKNSWGMWGEKGYFRMFRGQNVCGITEMATSAIIN
uniref:Pept_C1 domain-containing protein n=1 Tax=Rhabditophanes sp. KR3021 TaxID=114890 RepID=A0AC35TSM1_9BILA